MATDSPIAFVRSAWGLRGRISEWHTRDLTVGLVPTMGAVHDGHLALVRTMLERCDRTVVSIFVNPKQFGPGEDFDRYPRQEDRDAVLLAEAGAHLIYAPSVEEMYPPGFATTIHVGGLSQELEGASRSGHFDGVATVVAKLLIQARCDAAIFGEKDYQQLQVIRRMAADLDLPTQILAGETVREADGLAVSSRNAYLDKDQRRIAPALYRELTRARDAVLAGRSVDTAGEECRNALLEAGFDAVDYVTFRDAETLKPAGAEGDRSLRLLAAARLGKTRLLDNLSVPLAQAGDKPSED